ncbi:hypothetical protein CMI37_15650 [Candidatus Pacearchaeota archaeon]|nr:hypothetical protein [Candidatus Pacearchaeota archaeon]
MDESEQELDWLANPWCLMIYEHLDEANMCLNKNFIISLAEHIRSALITQGRGKGLTKLFKDDSI